MSQGPRYRVPFRRRREARTDYRARLGLIRSGLPRAVVRKTLNNTVVQLVAFDPKGDRVLASAVSRELRKHEWKGATGNVPAAYLTGYLAGKRAVAHGVEKAVLDIGLVQPTKGGRIFAALKGLVDAGLEIPHGDGILPSEERLRGAHIAKADPAEFDKVKSKLEAT